jgi:predicted adenylyl cyclase CyaB
MARNIELKARVNDLDALELRVRELADEGPIEINQDDTFFRCNAGRLKLRMIADDAGELIFYQRDDEAGPTESFYISTETSQPMALRESLSLAYGVAGQVIKRRKLYLIGRTRIHLDTVVSLGTFLELEVVLADGEPAEEASIEANEILQKLGVRKSELIDAAYVDILARDPRAMST